MGCFVSKESGLSSVENALRVLELFTPNEAEKRVTEIAKELNLAKSTVARLLKTLLKHGYVKQNEETKKYSLGNKILTLYGSLIENLEIVKEAYPFLKALADETSEAILLAQLEQDYVIYIEEIKSTYSIKIFAHKGRINPVHSTSSGKVLLAHKSTEEIEAFLSTRLEKTTAKTIIDKDTLRQQLMQIREVGYSYIENEYIDGIFSVAAPVRDYSNEVIAAVALVGPTQRINKEKTQQYIKMVSETAKKISRHLGYANR